MRYLNKMMQADRMIAILCFVSLPISATAQTSGGDYDLLSQLNEDYLESYVSGDTGRFDEILADDYRETEADGTMLNRTEFLAKIALRASDSPPVIEAAELEIRIFDDLAIIHAIPLVTLSNGAAISGGRYTDVYARIEGKWLCVAAHLGS